MPNWCLSCVRHRVLVKSIVLTPKCRSTDVMAHGMRKIDTVREKYGLWKFETRYVPTDKTTHPKPNPYLTEVQVILLDQGPPIREVQL